MVAGRHAHRPLTMPLLPAPGFVRISPLPFVAFVAALRLSSGSTCSQSVVAEALHEDSGTLLQRARQKEAADGAAANETISVEAPPVTAFTQVPVASPGCEGQPCPPIGKHEVLVLSEGRTGAGSGAVIMIVAGASVLAMLLVIASMVVLDFDVQLFDDSRAKSDPRAPMPYSPGTPQRRMPSRQAPTSPGPGTPQPSVPLLRTAASVEERSKSNASAQELTWGARDIIENCLCPDLVVPEACECILEMPRHALRTVQDKGMIPIKSPTGSTVLCIAWHQSGGAGSGFGSHPPTSGSRLLLLSQTGEATLASLWCSADMEQAGPRNTPSLTVSRFFDEPYGTITALDSGGGTFYCLQTLDQWRVLFHVGSGDGITPVVSVTDSDGRLLGVAETVIRGEETFSSMTVAPYVDAGVIVLGMFAVQWIESKGTGLESTFFPTSPSISQRHFGA